MNKKSKSILLLFDLLLCSRIIVSLLALLSLFAVSFDLLSFKFEFNIRILFDFVIWLTLVQIFSLIIQHLSLFFFMVLVYSNFSSFHSISAHAAQCTLSTIIIQGQFESSIASFSSDLFITERTILTQPTEKLIFNTILRMKS